MARNNIMLQKNDLSGDIEIHTDLLSPVPTSLSRKRAYKVGNVKQEPMGDRGGTSTCILCHPDKKISTTSSLKASGASPHKLLIPDKVGCFENDFPYLPRDQHVVYLWHSNLAVREKCLHRFKLEQFGKSELFWLLKGCIQLGNKYKVPRNTFDLMRMVVGFNLGSLAGQSIPHFHLQYGWEVVLTKEAVSQKALELYFEELDTNRLILHNDNKIMIVAPWTPKGQFALDVYFKGKYEISSMNESDLKIFAVIGHTIIRDYLARHIQNVNIVFSNSPEGRTIQPLVAHFVPRVNMTALYEMKGVNVVDTPPEKIAEEFRVSPTGGMWGEVLKQVESYNPIKEFDDEIKSYQPRGLGRNGKKKTP